MATKTSPKKSKTKAEGFDYTFLKKNPGVLKKIKACVTVIRKKMEDRIKNAVAIGGELKNVKRLLDHGQFGSWLRAEFYWTVRTAENYMSVAEWLGKYENFSDSSLAVSAAYLLTSRSVPEKARKRVLEKVQEGERVGLKEAREIIKEVRKEAENAGVTGNGKPDEVKTPAERLTKELNQVLDRFKKDVDQTELARRLRELADSLDPPTG